MFEEAIRNKYRFPSDLGNLDVEDLYDLPVKQLDNVFKRLNGQLKAVTEESLLETKTDEEQEVENKIAIVKHIVGVKVAEQNARLLERQKAEKKQRLLEILKDKQDASLMEKSEEEIEEMLNSL